jgi:CheY-like chemotaxis protein
MTGRPVSCIIQWVAVGAESTGVFDSVGPAAQKTGHLWLTTRVFSESAESRQPPAEAVGAQTETLMDSQPSRDGEPQAFRAPYRILVVDDNRDAAESMRVLLQLLGGEVLTAYDGLQALASAERFLPHAVLLDIGLPKLDGFCAAQHIRAQDWGKNMILVAISGWCREEDRQHSRSAGFNGHLAKPVHVDEVRNLIQGLLDGAPSQSV